MLGTSTIESAWWAWESSRVHNPPECATPGWGLAQRNLNIASSGPRASMGGWGHIPMCISGTSGGGSKLKVALKQATEVSRKTFAARAMQCQQNGFDLTVTEFFYLKRVSLLVV